VGVKLDSGRLDLGEAAREHLLQAVGDGKRAAVIDEDVAEE